MDGDRVETRRLGGSRYAVSSPSGFGRSNAFLCIMSKNSTFYDVKQISMALFIDKMIWQNDRHNVTCPCSHVLGYNLLFWKISLLGVWIAQAASAYTSPMSCRTVEWLDDISGIRYLYIMCRPEYKCRNIVQGHNDTWPIVKLVGTSWVWARGLNKAAAGDTDFLTNSYQITAKCNYFKKLLF